MWARFRRRAASSASGSSGHGASSSSWTGFWRVLGTDLRGLAASARCRARDPYSREELERNGIFGRSVWSDSVATGYSAHVVWKSREPGRVNVALLGGVSWRTFDRFHSMTVTSVGPGVTYPPGHPNLSEFCRDASTDRRRPDRRRPRPDPRDLGPDGRPRVPPHPWPDHRREHLQSGAHRGEGDVGLLRMEKGKGKMEKGRLAAPVPQGEALFHLPFSLFHPPLSASALTRAAR